ncbi:MAG: TetR/AcrR family transcriptional regulator [Lachnospiraceae bacterium]|nr:TetR/AcrR family transcriptional regulator [Lachnospiraceae bacterium]
MARVSKSIDEIKEEIMRACIVLFNEKGLKFTMDDVAGYCHISKKTMYVVYSDKEALFLAVVDYLFDGIKESEREVMRDKNLTTLEKIRKILGVMPESYRELDFGKMYILKDKYPAIYEKVEKRLETGWETTIELMEQGIKEGVLKPVDISIVKLMFESALEQFFRRDVFSKTPLSYREALDQVVDIILEGIKK